MIGRLLRSADFERVLAAAPCARSAHFAVHHHCGTPGRPRPEELSTDDEQASAQAVDDCPAPGLWLGAVVPKRHARRAVTRNLLKRQIRRAAEARQSGMTPGLWVVRLRAPFDRTQFTSPASPALRRAARDELFALLERASARLGAGNMAEAGP